MKYEEFLQGTAFITAMNGKDFTELQLQLYFDFLKDIETKVYIEGLKRMFLERPYPSIPQVAEIREYCLGSKNGKHLIAADKLRKALKSFGSYSTIVFDDPILHIIIDKRFSGWIKFCKLTQDELNEFFSFEFEKIYKVYSEQKHNDIKTELLGLYDAKNSDVEGWKVGMYTRYVGDEKKAKQWVLQYKEKVENNMINQNIKELV